ncbi:MAG: redoxin domain-containing protein [Microbacterium sp.]
MGEWFRPHRGTTRLSNEGRFPSLDGASQWLNSPPLTPTGLSGKVVVVNFCTYTCINWLRTLPYVRAWAERYRDDGLVMIGVHTPEFSFEHDVENVKEMLAAMRVNWAIALDNDYAVWDAFANHYWPALYFIDTSGRIRHHRFGEGDYEASEHVIQELLRETGADVGDDPVPVTADGPEVEADWKDLESAETHLGYDRAQGFASPGGMAPKERQLYASSRHLGSNQWALAGDWTVDADRVHLNEGSGRIDFSFHARDVHLVMGPPERGMSIPFRVTIDDEPPGVAAGSDVSDDGAGVLSQQRMYQLVRQRGPIFDRTFTIEFFDRGAEAFAFTFG